MDLSLSKDHKMFSQGAAIIVISVSYTFSMSITGIEQPAAKDLLKRAVSTGKY